MRSPFAHCAMSTRWPARFRLDYRFYGDSWGVLGHTVEPGLARALGACYRIDVWARLHVQSSASFWAREYVVANPGAVPIWRTMDRSLSSSWHTTGGARISYRPRQRRLVRGSQRHVTLDSSITLLIDRRMALITQFGIRWDI